MNLKLYILLIAFCVENISCDSDDNCNFHTCGECISSPHGQCVWCAQEDIKERRCMPMSAIKTDGHWCNKPVLTKSYSEVLLGRNFGEKIDDVDVQFKPQHLKIKTRPGYEMKIDMAFQPAKDYPLDVYYLIDVSYTMQQKKKDLETQAVNIYEQLTSYTNNVQLGIGSFVEKPGFPFVDEHRTPVPHTAHAFKNHLSLTDDVQLFTKTIRNITFGANYDDPEAGLDGLMQAMTCQKELGWEKRKGSRRIIVLCTDSIYHSAGDGKIVGAIKPNDMQCHLEDNLYNNTLALTYDYPSVSQINKIASEGQFRIVFAAKKSVSAAYKGLANNILGAKYAVLEGGTDAVELIKEAYLEYQNRGQLVYNWPPFVQLTIDQDCNTKPPKNCISTPNERTVNIQGKLLVKYCPPDGKMHHNLTVGVFGINDKLVIELEIDCQCDCEKVTGPTDKKCHDAGFMQCGICKCHPGSYGVDCRCNGTSTDKKDMESCKLNIDDKMLCSGRGTCRCGKCEVCQPGFSGDFCEFDDNACPRHNKLLCSNNGRCHRGGCVCDAQWAGDDCSCSLDHRKCIAPYSMELCSGNGKCVCGKCECNQLENKNETYTGSYCDVCDDCAATRCKDFEEYVHCNVMNDKKLCDEKFNRTDSIVIFLNKNETNGPEWNIASLCKTRLDNDSYVIFKYQYEDGAVVLGIQRELELPPEVDILVAVGSAIGAVLLIGVLTLIIWKILIDLHDKREFEKFSKESQANGYEICNNVLYQEPGTTFANPTFETK